MNDTPETDAPIDVQDINPEAVLAVMRARCKRMERERNQERVINQALRDALQEDLEYFADLEDADHDGQRFIGNDEMQRAQAIRETLAKAKKSLPTTPQP